MTTGDRGTDSRGATKIAVVAFGGNALVRDPEHDSIGDQYETVCGCVPPLADLVADGWRLVVSHGNGPQVGFILRRSELALAEVNPVPLDYAVADTQGAIGSMFVKALTNELRRRGLDLPVVALVTHCLVDPADPAFAAPSKPIGSFLDEATARSRAAELGWTVGEDAGRGWRRTVGSPAPQRIVEAAAVRGLLDAGSVVVAAGGGGIPVSEAADGTLTGVEAVIDKDLAGALLARELGARLFLVPTAVPRVAIRFGRPDQEWLEQVGVEQARALIASGELGAGSMEPKVAAVADFVAAVPGAVAVIGDAGDLAGMIAGTAGTRFVGAPLAGAAKKVFPLAVNGSLMRGLPLNHHLVEIGARFVREALTEPVYRLWTIEDDHPAMLRVGDARGAAVAVEVWEVPDRGMATLLSGEPDGLSIGRVRLEDGATVLGVLGEPALVEGREEITRYGGWREYLAAKDSAAKDSAAKEPGS